MDLATPLSSSHPLWTQSTHAEPQRLHQQMHPMKSPGQPNYSDGPQPLAAISRSPTGQSGATLATGPVTMPPSVSPPPAQPRPVSAIGSSTKDPHANSVVRDQKNEYSYPREPQKVYFDAIERLQIQTAQNTSALAAQARNQIDYTELVRQTEGSLRHEFQTQLHRQDQELRRMDEVVGRLLQELQDCRRSIVSLAQRVEITQRPGEATQPGYQDEALELMARRIGEVSHRTTDLETLRDHMAIVSGRVQRLESESAAAHSSHSRPVLPTYQPAHSAHVAHAIAPHTTHVAPFQTPSRPTSNPQLMSHNEKPPTVVPPESVQRHESTPVQNGWTTVNAGTKRAHENGTNSPIQGENSAQGSPKRLRLATGESQEAQAVAQIPPGPPHILPSQTQIVVTSQSQSQSQPGLDSIRECTHYHHHGPTLPMEYRTDHRNRAGDLSRSVYLNVLLAVEVREVAEDQAAGEGVYGRACRDNIIQLGRPTGKETVGQPYLTRKAAQSSSMIILQPGASCGVVAEVVGCEVALH